MIGLIPAALASTTGVSTFTESDRRDELDIVSRFSVSNAIQDQVQREDMVRWAYRTSPAIKLIPDLLPRQERLSLLKSLISVLP